MAQTSDDNERRREARAPIELKVEYKRLNTFFYDYTKNISKGGTFIKTDKPLDVGTIFLFKLMLPAQASPIALRGEVRWVVKQGEPMPPGVPAGHDAGMGIKFVYDTAEQRRELEQVVEKMMVDSLGPLIYSRLVKPPAGEEPAAPGGADEPRPRRVKTKPRFGAKS
jgi:type IV pilus assembly protein PilZ